MVSRLVVTGAGGFIGGHLLPVLAARGHEVLAVDLRETAGRIEGVRYHTCDLADPSSLLPRDAGGWGPFTLIHLAWNLRREGGPALQNEQVAILERLLAQHGSSLARVIVTGSAEEYGSRGGLLREDDPGVEPLSAYGSAKNEARVMTQTWSSRAGVPVLWLRPFVVYGPGQGGDMLVPYAVRCATEKRRAEFSDGLQQRDFVHVRDLADAIARGVDAPVEGFHVLNIATGRAVAVRDVLALVAEVMGAKDTFAIGARPRRPGEPDVQVADCARAESSLGWRAKVDWRSGIRSLCEGARS